MRLGIFLVMVLFASLLLFGCAKKGVEGGPQAGQADGVDEGSNEDEDGASDTETAETDDDQPSSGVADDGDVSGDGDDDAPSMDDEALADLFDIDTDKPLSDEGFGVGVPASD